MAASISTLNAASAALNSLLTRRQKQKSKSGSRGSSPSSGADAIKKRKVAGRKTRLRHEVKPKGQPKSKLTLTEEEELRLQQLAAEEKLNSNVKILRELGKEGKREREAREELLQLRRQKDLARKGKSKKVEVVEDEWNSDSD